jgi:hypothetical protein
MSRDMVFPIRPSGLGNLLPTCFNSHSQFFHQSLQLHLITVGPQIHLSGEIDLQPEAISSIDVRCCSGHPLLPVDLGSALSSRCVLTLVSL